MPHFSSLVRLLAALLLAAPLAHAQAPAWGGAAVGSLSQASGSSQARAVATDASGNVFVTGNFVGTVTFGSTVLTSAGSADLFVAKYVPATSTWAWAQRGGGTGYDEGTSLAVQGGGVYVTGAIFNSLTNASAVSFGGAGPATSATQVNGASSNNGFDLLLVKYTDAGSSALLTWTQVGGGTSTDYGYGVAVSGSSVYVAGTFSNTTANASAVVFGGGGTTAGARQVNGASPQPSFDLLLAKYTDNGPSATLGWTQVGGGSSTDLGFAVAVRGTSVYVAGTIANNTANVNAVVVGGGGTTAGTSPVPGASATSSQDVVLAKYTDQGATATYNWVQVGGGTSADFGNGVAVSGTSVYVAGSITNSSANNQGVLFGGTGSTAGSTQVNGASSASTSELLLAKYQDNGATATLGWTQVGGGGGSDAAYGVAASNTSLYVTGYLVNTTSNANAVVFGGGGTTAGTVPVSGASTTPAQDVVLAKYIDNGNSATYAWAQVGGGTGADYGNGVAVSGQQVYVGSVAVPPVTFGPTTLTTPAGSTVAVLPYLTDATLLPTRPAASTAGLALYPNPTSHGAATLTGAAPGAPVQVLDALGRLVRTATADATGTATLAGLPAGLYLVRAGAGAGHLSVE